MTVAPAPGSGDVRDLNGDHPRLFAVGSRLFSVVRRVRSSAWLGRGSVLGAVLIIDLVSKHWARTYLPHSTPGNAIIHLQLVANRGASFGVGAGRPALVLWSSLIATAGCLWWLVIVRGRAQQVAVAAVVGGALGNLVDRLVHGAVTDWIHLSGYPATFNLADIALRTGLVTVLAVQLRRSGRHAAH